MTGKRNDFECIEIMFRLTPTMFGTIDIKSRIQLHSLNVHSYVAHRTIIVVFGPLMAHVTSMQTHAQKQPYKYAHHSVSNAHLHEVTSTLIGISYGHPGVLERSLASTPFSLPLHPSLLCCTPPEPQLTSSVQI